MQIREKKRYTLRAPSQWIFLLLLWLFCLVVVVVVLTRLRSLTENNMAVEHGLSLFLDLPPPALLCVLHFVQHVGPRVRTGQNVVSVGKRLLVLKTQNEKNGD